MAVSLVGYMYSEYSSLRNTLPYRQLGRSEAAADAVPILFLPPFLQSTEYTTLSPSYFVNLVEVTSCHSPTTIHLAIMLVVPSLGHVDESPHIAVCQDFLIW